MFNLDDTDILYITTNIIQKKISSFNKKPVQRKRNLFTQSFCFPSCALLCFRFHLQLRNENTYAAVQISNYPSMLWRTLQSLVVFVIHSGHAMTNCTLISWIINNNNRLQSIEYSYRTQIFRKCKRSKKWTKSELQINKI